MSDQSTFDERFTQWWIRYLKKWYIVGPDARVLHPYDVMETAAYDAAQWVRRYYRERS